MSVSRDGKPGGTGAEPPRQRPLREGLAARARGLIGAAWGRLRELTGDDAYDRYLRHHAQAHPGDPPLSRKEFFVQEQERKWSGVRRCC